MPRVRAAAMRFGSTCSNAPLAERYMSGKDITTAASTVAVQEKAIFTPKYCKKKMPIGRFTPNRYKRKKPATVGGSTSGSVSTPSRRIFIRSFFMLTTHQAARIPRKKVSTMETLAVFMEIRIGDQSILLLLSFYLAATKP